MAMSEDIKELEKLLELKKKQIRLEQDINRQQQLQSEAKAYEKSIKRLKDQEGQLDEIQKKQERIKGGWDDIGRAIGNVPLGQFITFKQGTDDIAASINEINDNIDKVVNSINRDFAKADIKIPKPSTKAFQSVISELEAQIPGMGQDLQDALTSGDIGTYYKKYGEEGRKLAIQAMDKKKGFVGVATYFGKEGQGPKDLETFKKGLKGLEEEAKKFRASIDFSGIFDSMRRNVLENIGFTQIIRGLRDFDNSLSDLKRNFQIPAEDFTKASLGMSELTRKGAQFGLTTKDTFDLVKGIGEESRTTNLKSLQEISSQVMAVPRATGIALAEVTKITGQMTFFGASSERVGAAFKNISNQSKIFGVQSSKVAAQFSAAFPKFKAMGMKGSDSAIAAMAAQAEKLGINLESAVTSSKNFLDIGESMESAADLSLLGGAAAQISFTDLMQARLDPEKMTKLQEQLVSDLGRINKATGELELSYFDTVQLQERAARSGIEYDVLFKRLKGKKEDLAKIAMFDPNELNKMSEEQKQFLLSRTVNKGGKFEVEGFEGIKDLRSISQEVIDAEMKKLKLDEKSLEDQAKATQSFDESMNALKGSFLAIFNNLQPVLQKLTEIIVWATGWINKLFDSISKLPGGEIWSVVVALIPVLFLTFGSMKGLGKMLMTGFSGLTKALGKIPGVGGMFKKKAAETITQTTTGGAPDIGGKAGKMPKKGPTFLQQFAKISPAQLLSLAVAIAAVGAAFMMIGKGIEFAANGLSKLVSAFKDTKNAGMALGAVTVVMASFVVMMGIMIPLVRVLGSVGRTAAPGILAVGAALLLMGLGINLASKGLAVLVEAFGKTENAGMALGAVTVVVGGFIAAIAVFATMGPAIGAAISALGTGIAGFIGAITPALVGFAQAMAAPTVLFGLPVGLIVLAMAMGLATALRIMAPAIEAMGPLLAGLGEMFKGLAPVVEAAANGLAKIVTAVGDGIVKIIKQITVSIQDLASINALQLYAVAGGIGAIGLALAGFGGGSMLGGIGKAIGDFFGGDPVANLMKFAKIPGDNLVKVSNAIKELASGLKSLNSVDLKNFTSQIDKLGSLNSKGFTKLIDLSKDSTKAKMAAEALTKIGKELSVVPTVNLTNVSNLANTIELIATKVKAGLEKLGDFKGFLQGKAAVSTAQSLSDIAQALNKVPTINASAITALANALGNMGKVTEGLDAMKGGFFGFAGAKQAAIDISEIAIAIGKIPEVRVAPLNSLAAALGTNIEKVKQGIEKLSGGLFGFAGAKKGALDIAAIAKALNTIQEVRATAINSLVSVLGPNIEKVKAGIEKLSGGLFGFSGAKKGAMEIAAIAGKLNAIPFIKYENINSLTVALTMLGSKAVSAIDKLKGFKGEGLDQLDLLGKRIKSAFIVLSNASVFANNANATILGLVSVAQNINKIESIKQENMLGLASALEKSVSNISKGIKALASLLAVVSKATQTATGLQETVKQLNGIPPVSSKPLMDLSDTLQQSMKGISRGVRIMASMQNKVVVAVQTAKSLIELAASINAIPPVSNIPLKSLSIALMPVSRIRIGLVRLISLQKHIPGAIVAINGLAKIAQSISKIGMISPKPIKTLAATINETAGVLRKGILKFMLINLFMGGAIKTTSGIATIFSSLATIGNVNKKKIIDALPMLNGLVAHLKKFSSISEYAPQLISASMALRHVAFGLEKTGKGFTEFTKIPTEGFKNIGGSIKNMVDSIGSMSSGKDNMISNIQTLASTMSKLGMALKEVSIGFTNSAKAMAAFNVQIERMKMNANVAEKGPAPAAKKLGEKAPASGIPIKEAATEFAGPNAPGQIKIAPIHINLKINGKDVQEMIVDAQFYR